MLLLPLLLALASGGRLIGAIDESEIPGRGGVSNRLANRRFVDDEKLQEYFCQRELAVSNEHYLAKYLRLRGLSVPNAWPGMEIEDVYAQAVERLTLRLPHVKYVSLSGE